MPLGLSVLLIVAGVTAVIAVIATLIDKIVTNREDQ